MILIFFRTTCIFQDLYSKKKRCLFIWQKFYTKTFLRFFIKKNIVKITQSKSSGGGPVKKIVFPFVLHSTSKYVFWNCFFLYIFSSSSPSCCCKFTKIIMIITIALCSNLQHQLESHFILTMLSLIPVVMKVILINLSQRRVKNEGRFYEKHWNCNGCRWLAHSRLIDYAIRQDKKKLPRKD